MLQIKPNINNRFGFIIWMERIKKFPANRRESFGVANGARTHDPQNHNLML